MLFRSQRPPTKISGRLYRSGDGVIVGPKSMVMKLSYYIDGASVNGAAPDWSAASRSRSAPTWSEPVDGAVEALDVAATRRPEEKS